MQPNQLKAKLKAGQTVIGPYVRHAEPGVAEILCYLGFDFLFFDSEHAPIGERDCENLARVCELTGVTSIARVPANLPWMIGRYLDTGIEGVQIPMVNSAAEALAAVRAARYQPLGNRGLAGARAAQYGQVLPFSYASHIETSNAETMVIVQVETPESIEALPEIVTIPGIDVVFIGPTDLSNSLGHPGDFKHPEVQAAFDRIIDIVGNSDKVLGVLATTTEASLEWQAWGARYLLCVFEAILGPAVRSFLSTIRRGLDPV
ncbi:MAG: aldolase/citrate lyase family protein [Bryobacteraceae bacterium]